MRAARLLECTTVRTISGRVKTRRVAFAVTFFIRPFGMWKLEKESACCAFESRNERD